MLIHTTRETDPEDVLAEAGLTLDADDTYTTHSGDGVSRIQVRRNHTVTIDYYGRIIQVDSLGETVDPVVTGLSVKICLLVAASPSAVTDKAYCVR